MGLLRPHFTPFTSVAEYCQMMVGKIEEKVRDVICSDQGSLGKKLFYSGGAVCGRDFDCSVVAASFDNLDYDSGAFGKTGAHSPQANRAERVGIVGFQVPNDVELPRPLTSV